MYCAKCLASSVPSHIERMNGDASTQVAMSVAPPQSTASLDDAEHTDSRDARPAARSIACAKPPIGLEASATLRRKLPALTARAEIQGAPVLLAAPRTKPVKAHTHTHAQTQTEPKRAKKPLTPRGLLEELPLCFGEGSPWSECRAYPNERADH